MPPKKRKRVEVHSCLEDQANKPRYPPEKYKNHLACPFSKHDPDLHLTVNNVCTGRWGFKTIGALNDHMQRVHSRKFGCIVCKLRFTQSKKGQSKKDTIEQAKRSHDCKPRDFTDEDPQWMTEDQESRLAKWKEPGIAQGGGAKSWIKIYMCLFRTAEKDVPSPFYDYMVPKHLVSNSYKNDTLKPHIHIDAINPSLTQREGSATQGMRNLGALEDNYRPQLDRNTLERYSCQEDHEFDWSIKPAIDSGYGSGNAQDLQEQNTLFSQDLPTSFTQPLLRAEEIWPSGMWTLGNSDEAVDYDKFLDLEEKSG